MSKNQIIDNLEYMDNNGTLRFKDVRYLLIRPETVNNMYVNIRNEFGEGVDRFFFFPGLIF